MHIELSSRALYGSHMEVPPEIFERYFSPWSAHMIEASGVLYPTVEHAYHCMRYTGMQEILEEILSARSPQLAWEVSQKHKPRQVAYFPSYKTVVMQALCKLKLEQHADVRRALIESKGLEIVKRIVTGPPGDGFWDDGPDGTGDNKFGKIWMKLRKEN